MKYRIRANTPNDFNVAGFMPANKRFHNGKCSFTITVTKMDSDYFESICKNDNRIINVKILKQIETGPSRSAGSAGTDEITIKKGAENGSLRRRVRRKRH